MIKTLTTTVAALAIMATAALAQEGDPAKGETDFRRCQACHMVGENAQHRVGPHLNGIVGRQIGAAEGYNYGPATAAKGEDGTVWTEELLFEYLADPMAFVGGASKMVQKFPDEQLRWDVIAYIAQFNADGTKAE